MNKADLVKEVMNVVCSRAEAEDAVNTVISSISGALKKGERVSLVGFGTFSVVQRKARNGRNPQTGKALKIKAKKVPKFTPGKALKEAVK
jgi:DNA-binding protein HU-beta